MQELIIIVSSNNNLLWYQFLIRTIIVGILLFFLGRMIPRRAAGGYSAFDFTFFWMMGGLIASPLFDSRISFRDTLIAVVTVLVTHKVIAILTCSNRLIDSIIKGNKIPIINNGKLIIDNMNKALINNEIFFSELRKNDIFNVSHVQYAFYENNGKLSVSTFPQYQTITKKDLNLPIKTTVVPQLIISDGKIDTEILIHTDLNSNQLINKLHKNNIRSIKEVFIGYWEGAKTLIVFRKNKM